MDALWEDLLASCMAFEGAAESNPWDHRDFTVKGKTFVFTNGPHPEGIKITAKPLPENKAMWLGQEGVSVAGYVGRFGWVSFTIRTEADLAMAKDLIAESYAVISKRRR